MTETSASESPLPLRCPHHEKCNQDGCAGCQESVTSRMNAAWCPRHGEYYSGYVRCPVCVETAS